MIELKEIFLDLYHEWFQNKSYWFKKNIDNDKYLSEKYWYKIKDIREYNNELNNEDIKIQIGAIIAYDQIPRHYNRIENIDVLMYSNIATNISVSLMILLSKNIDSYKLISAYEWCFILLPIRHTNDIVKIKNVINFIIEKHNTNDTLEEDKKIYKNFLENTIRKIYKLYTSEFILEQKNLHKIKNNTINQWIKYENILHHIPSHAIIFNLYELSNFDLIKKFKQEIKYIYNENIIVSLSGGVDSAVCLYLVKQYFPYNNITAVHINYNNRDECKDELKFIQKYCAILNIKLFYRTIDEISRNNCHHNGLRNLYENITKEIRFDTYRQVANLLEGKSVVMLGHNMDDCFENIITNISLKHDYNNLAGISRLSVISDICFWRPLLNIKKHEIIHFAMNVYIPFLKNSTPTWSARGKIRDIILPALQNINPNIMQSFFDLKEYVKESDGIINEFVISRLIKEFNYDNDVISGIFKINELLDNKNIWIKLFQDYNFKTFFNDENISSKSLHEFIEFIKRFKDKYITCDVNKKIKFILKKNIEVVLIKKKENDVYILFLKRMIF